MLRLKSSHVEVYVFRRRARRVQYLVLRRSEGRSLPGVWQPITGKRERGETAVRAAVREVAEETGLTPLRLWSLETQTVFFDAVADAFVLLPLFALEVAPGAPVRLSREHDAFAFVSAGEAARRVLWESQRRGLSAVRAEVLRSRRLARELELPSPGRSRGRLANRAAGTLRAPRRSRKA
jgi:dATP pyrophosphohydrolase